MGNRILITGASGSVGGALLAQLKAETRASGLTLVAASRSLTQRQVFAAQDVESVALDYADAASVSAAMRNIDQLFLCTGYTIDMLVHSKLALDAALDAGRRLASRSGAGLCPCLAGIGVFLLCGREIPVTDLWKRTRCGP